MSIFNQFYLLIQELYDSVACVRVSSDDFLINKLNIIELKS
jgi:hypothetical protein